MRARRIIAVASVAVGLVALSGCRSEPGVAAYVGDHRITEDAVTEVVDDVRAKNPTPTDPAELAFEGQRPPLPGRSQVVSTLVLTEVCQRVSAEKGYRPDGQVDPAQLAQQVGLAPETGYAQQLAALETCLAGIPAGDLVAPTEQEMADLVAAGKQAGAIPAEVTVEQAAPQLDGPQLRSTLAKRNALAEAVEAYDVTVNPRYRPLEFPLLRFSGRGLPTAVGLPLGEPASGTVTDVSTPKPVPAASEPFDPADG